MGERLEAALVGSTRLKFSESTALDDLLSDGKSSNGASNKEEDDENENNTSGQHCEGFVSVWRGV